jgi:hypothetical protein
MRKTIRKRKKERKWKSDDNIHIRAKVTEPVIYLTQLVKSRSILYLNASSRIERGKRNIVIFVETVPFGEAAMTAEPYNQMTSLA